MYEVLVNVIFETVFWCFLLRMFGCFFALLAFLCEVEIMGTQSKRIEWTLQEFYLTHRNGRRLVEKLCNSVRILLVNIMDDSCVLIAYLIIASKYFRSICGSYV